MPRTRHVVGARRRRPDAVDAATTKATTTTRAHDHHHHDPARQCSRRTPRCPRPATGSATAAQAVVVGSTRAHEGTALRSGPVDGVFDQDTQYAVTTVQKYFGLPRTGVIDPGVDLALTRLPLQRRRCPKSEPDRVEIDLDKQVLTLYKNWQPSS